MPSNLSPAERSLRGRIAAHRNWATTESVEGTAASRAAFFVKFIDEDDPDRLLPEKEQRARAEHARSANFSRIALILAKARCEWEGLGVVNRRQRRRPAYGRGTAVNLLGRLDGARIPGGCGTCEPYQTAELVVAGASRAVVHQYDWSAVLARVQGRTA